MSAVDRLRLALSAEPDADEATEKNEPKEGTPADLSEDQAEAIKALADAVDAVKEAFAEFKSQSKKK